MPSKILVTGAAGFIAARVVEMLVADGHDVVGVDNLNSYYDVRLKDYRLARLLGMSSLRPEQLEKSRSCFAKGAEFRSGRFTFVPLDIENRTGLTALFERHGFEAVINLAARAGVRYSMDNPSIYFTTNVLGALNLLECQRQFKVKKYVMASTSSLYAGLPMPFSEELPVNTPISPYAASKKSAEITAYTYHKQFGIDVSVLRYFTVYGPAGRPDMAPLRFMHWIATGKPLKLFGDGSAARDFTYVDDIARGTILALRPLGYEILNLGGGNNPQPISLLISKIENALGKRAIVDRQPSHSADMDATWADISKAQRLLGWQPKTLLAEGVRRSAAWYREYIETVGGLELEAPVVSGSSLAPADKHFIS